MRVLKLLLPILLVLITTAAFADTFLDNTATLGTATPPGFYLGGSVTTASGLNFYAPTNGDNTLSNFSLFLDGANINSSADQVEAVIATWNGTGIGNIVWTSAAMTVTSDNGTSAFSPYTFSPNLALTTGASYVAFLSDSFSPGSSYSSFNNGDFALIAVVYQSNDNLPGGVNGPAQVQFLYDNGYTTTYPSTWDSENTDPVFGGYQYASGYDAAFQADFTSSSTPSPVPEPGSFLLLGSGIAGVLEVFRRKLDR